MQKPEKIVSLETPQDAVRVDNLFSLIFQEAQGKEFQYLTFEGTGVWPVANNIGEKQVVICKNTTDAAVRLYTKVAGSLKYLVFI